MYIRLLEDHVARTFFFTFAAVCTLTVVDMRYEIGHCDGASLTVLFTFLTADAADITAAGDYFTFVFGAAVYECCLVVRHQLDQVFRTFRDTFTTGFTCLFVYDSHPVYDMYGIKGAG